MSGKSVLEGAYTAFPTPYISELTRSRLYGSLTQTGLHSIACRRTCHTAVPLWNRCARLGQWDYLALICSLKAGWVSREIDW